METIKILWKGFRFGMLLQLAVGPMCLLVFNTSAAQGFGTAMSLVAAIALVDLLFIALSGLGVSAIMERPGIKRFIKLFGAVVLVVFGLNMAAGALGYALLPGSLSLFSHAGGRSAFMQGLLLTLSNPLTIIFWSGVFSTQVIENQYDRAQLCFFGAGCVLATLFFLSLVAALGTAVSGFLSDGFMRTLNVAVGAFIVYSGLVLLLRRDKAA